MPLQSAPAACAVLFACPRSPAAGGSEIASMPQWIGRQGACFSAACKSGLPAGKGAHSLVWPSPRGHSSPFLQERTQSPAYILCSSLVLHKNLPPSHFPPNLDQIINTASILTPKPMNYDLHERCTELGVWVACSPQKQESDTVSRVDDRECTAVQTLWRAQGPHHPLERPLVRSHWGCACALSAQDDISLDKESLTWQVQEKQQVVHGYGHPHLALPFIIFEF